MWRNPAVLPRPWAGQGDAAQGKKPFVPHQLLSSIAGNITTLPPQWINEWQQATAAAPTVRSVPMQRSVVAHAVQPLSRLIFCQSDRSAIEIYIPRVTLQRSRGAVPGSSVQHAALCNHTSRPFTFRRPLLCRTNPHRASRRDDSESKQTKVGLLSTLWE